MNGEPMRNATLLFRTAYCGNPVSAGHATDAELGAIAGPVYPASERDILHAWSLMAVRDPGGRGIEVHAAGWRVDLINTWATSGGMGIELQAQAVSMKSGHACRLELGAGQGLSPRLRYRLDYALHTGESTNVEL